MNELSKLDALLTTLAAQANAYDQRNKIPRLQNKPFFVPTLFKTQSSQLSNYVAESRTLLAQVSTYVEKNSSKELIAFQCDKLVEQCQAIKKVLTSVSQPVNNNKQDNTTFSWLTPRVINNSRALYLELSKHHGYQQKLTEKIAQLSQFIERCETDNKIGLQQQILRQHKRLRQCNKAIYFIEQKITQLESGKYKR